jgi:hypothetical protein
LSKVPLTLDESSNYAADYALPEPIGGSYRAITWFKGDADHPQAPSPEVFFVVDPAP